jgi:hypothetical protein
MSIQYRADSFAAEDSLVASMSQCAFVGARCMAPTPAEWTEQLLAIYAQVLGVER